MTSEPNNIYKDDEIVIRRAKIEDIRQIHYIESVCFDDPWSYEMLYNDIFDNDITVYMVVEKQGKVIGYGGMWIIFDEAHITNVCIHPELRRKGYAKKLMEVLTKEAADMGAYSMTLEVRVSNEGAMKLYNNCGFHIQGVRKKYYSNNGEDAYIMWREGSVENPAECIANAVK